MKGSKDTLTPVLDNDEGKIWQVDWGGMTLEFGTFQTTCDFSPLFRGLPDDRCQCPHWGYVIKGRLRYTFADREEIFGPSELYYVPPGHLPVIESGAEYVEFSPSDALQATMAVVERNFLATQQTP